VRNTLGTSIGGYRLLRCIRAYVELDLWASLTVHTEETIIKGRSAVRKFVKLANVSTYSALVSNVAIINTLSGILSEGLELPEDASDPAPFR
jgi:hypothetical protein